MNLLTRIQHDTAGLYRQVSRNARDCGPEFAGPCPFCGGRDRFHIWPEHPRGARAWCRQCEKSMDEIQYLRDRHSMSYAEALAALGRETTHPATTTTPNPPEPCEPPSADWQAHYNDLVLEWASTLWGDYTGPLDYLHQRGFDDETLIRAAIGYKATSTNDEQWGWLPRGIVIPVYIGADLWQVKVRRSDKDIARDEAAGRRLGKYINARGPANPLYNADAIRPGEPVCLVASGFLALSNQPI